MTVDTIAVLVHIHATKLQFIAIFHPIILSPTSLPNIGLIAKKKRSTRGLIAKEREAQQLNYEWSPKIKSSHRCYQ